MVALTPEIRLVPAEFFPLQNSPPVSVQRRKRQAEDLEEFFSRDGDETLINDDRIEFFMGEYMYVWYKSSRPVFPCFLG